MYRKVLDIVKNVNKPILGIYFGLHLIAYVFGIEVKHNKMSTEIKTLIAHYNESPNELIRLKGFFQCEVNHRDYVDANNPKIRNNFDILLTSQDGNHKYIQFMIHKEKPIYYVQFHPETRSKYDREVAKEHGEALIKNFINLIVSNFLA